MPAQVPYPPPGIEDVIHSPGARRLRKDALLEKAVTMSVISSVAPTLTAEDIQAGALMPPLSPLFPDAIIVAILTDFRLSIEGFSGSESQ